MSETACDVKANVTIYGKKYFVVSMDADIALNEFPRISLVLHEAEEAQNTAIALSSADAPVEMSSVQTKLFQERSSADSQIQLQVTGGESTSFNFNGVSIGGSYSYSAYSVVRNEMVAPEYAKIAALSAFPYTGHKGNRDTYDRPLIKDSKDIPTFFMDVFKDLQRNWQDMPDKEKSADYQMRKAQHQLNTRVQKFMQQLFNDSKESFGWKDIADILTLASGVTEDMRLRQVVRSIWTSTPGAFMNVIQRICAEFNCLYVPEWDKIGKFKNKIDLMKEPETLEVDVIDISINSVNGGNLTPCCYVAVIPADVKMLNRGEAGLDMFVAYPELNMKEGGLQISLPGPSWLPPADAAATVSKDGEPSKSRKPKANVDKAEQAAKDVVKGAVEKINKIMEILKEWAKAEYTYQALASTSATLTIPLKFEVEVGKRYNVKTKSGSALFEGILSEVHHSISTGDGNHPSAGTQLSFSCVTLPGFTLPEADK